MAATAAAEVESPFREKAKARKSEVGWETQRLRRERKEEGFRRGDERREEEVVAIL